MATPQEIADDLGYGELLTAQVDAGLDRADVLQSLYSRWANRLSSLARISAKGKAQVTSALQQGPWSAEHKNDLASIVLSGGTTPKAPSARRPTQKVMEFQNFIKLTTMLKLRDLKLSRASRMSLLAAEAKNIGVENADEKTLYRLTQILTYCEGNSKVFTGASMGMHGRFAIVQQIGPSPQRIAISRILSHLQLIFYQAS
jgi:hypothetical protein